MKSPLLVVASALLFQLLANPASAAEPVNRYLQGMLGQLSSDDIWQVDDPDTGDAYIADLDELIYGGGGVQMNFSQSAWEYGYETGGLISFNNDTNYFAASGENGGVVAFNIDNNFLLIDLYMGGFVGLKLGQHLRLYGAAGPALLFGSLDLGDQPAPAPNQQAIVISGEGRTSKASVGFYGRMGFDLLFDNGITLGASVRQVNAELDFGDAGLMDFNHPQYFINIGKVY